MATRHLAVPLAVDAVEPRPRETSPPLIHVLRPRLPSASELLPYLQEIDQARWYSNGGPLVTRLERELSRHFGLPNLGVVTAANCTLGLTAVLLAREVRPGSLCLMPSWTFAATPHAARAAGLVPFFHDVDQRTWALDPNAVRETLKRQASPIGAVMVVSPFGAPIDLHAWEKFEDDTGVPVVVDAAAGFDTARPSRIPSVVSLHATKILGAGEGGFIITADPRLRERLTACCNFGFMDSRKAILPATNAKMSEYHAAVALASLSAWRRIRAGHVEVAERYLPALGSLLQYGYGQGWVASTTNVVLPPGTRERITERLLESGIETRAWWGEGCHRQPAFAECPRGDLAVTEDLGGRVLGLPHFAEMQPEDVATVADAMSEALKSESLRRLSRSIGREE
jgi:dTDP-4-amino-4,6-dideoxygalactose transaminase